MTVRSCSLVSAMELRAIQKLDATRSNKCPTGDNLERELDHSVLSFYDTGRLMLKNVWGCVHRMSRESTLRYRRSRQL